MGRGRHTLCCPSHTPASKDAGAIFLYGDFMGKIVNERGYQVTGGGMPGMVTAKAKKCRKAFDDRLERLLESARRKDRGQEAK